MRTEARTSGAMLLLVAIAFSGHAARASNCRASVGGNAANTAVDHYVFDATLRQRWAVVVDCLHPERPATMTLMPTPMPTAMPLNGVWPGLSAAQMRTGERASAKIPGALPGPSLVIAGSRVDVWKDGPVRVQLSGIAAESAPLGEAVKVRAAGQGVLLRGIVRGAHSVELLEDSREWREP